MRVCLTAPCQMDSLGYCANCNPRPLFAPIPQSDNWQPIETKPPFVRCEERGIYTDTDGDGLFYFKATHWRGLP